MSSNALVLVDIQNDFIPGGALPARDGADVVPVANRLQKEFDVVVATQDWHPRDHLSFASNHSNKSPGDLIELSGLEQVLWPDHCVQGSRGADFHKDLDTDRISHVTRKGDDPRIDSYSGFFDNGHLRATDLEEYLRDRGVEHVYICGLATDYCVKYTALDSALLGFATTVVIDACRGVELVPGDIVSALDVMEKAGIRLITSSDLVG